MNDKDLTPQELTKITERLLLEERVMQNRTKRSNLNMESKFRHN